MRDTQLELEFVEEPLGDENFAWEAGCNHKSGAVEATERHLLLRSGGFSTTDQACGAALEAQDEWLEKFFLSEPAWELTAGRLTLKTGDTRIVLQETPR